MIPAITTVAEMKHAPNIRRDRTNGREGAIISANGITLIAVIDAINRSAGTFGPSIPAIGTINPADYTRPHNVISPEQPPPLP